jgi:hypothetical protein
MSSYQELYPLQLVQESPSNRWLAALARCNKADVGSIDPELRGYTSVNSGVKPMRLKKRPFVLVVRSPSGRLPRYVMEER